MKTLRILIVEDDAIVAMILGELLMGMGHEVCATAGTRFDAAHAAALHKPDLVIVDGTLGRDSGISAVDEILRAGPVPHFFLSGDVGRIKAARPDAIVVQKPFRLSDITRALGASFERVYGPAPA